VTRPTPIPQLTGLRTIGAVWVVSLHALSLTTALWPPWAKVSRLALGGNLGVDLFFVLSGFIISHNYLQELGVGSLRRTFHFWGLRLARLYPVFLLALVAWAMFLLLQSPQQDDLFSGPLSLRNIVMNLFLLNHVPPGSSIASTSWSVCLEFGAYLAFPVLALVLIRIRSAWVAAGLSVAVLAFGIWLLIRLDVQSFEFFTYHVGWVRLAVEFLSGCLIYVAWSLSGRWREGWHWDVVFVASAICIVYACLHEDPTHPGFFPLMAVPCLALVVVSCAGSTGVVRWFFSTRPLMWMGVVSYSLYMTHTFTLALVTNGLREWWLRWPPTPFVRSATPILIYVVIVLVAAGVYYLVEEPSRRKLRRTVDRLNAGVGSER
jgi:peptidoglycan/LPS O-acetylase OafA/YrhL